MDIEQLAERVISGDKQAISRAISIVEDRSLADECRNLMKTIYPKTGNIHVIGITGPPGVGKSTIIGQIALEMDRRKIKPSIIAVDATSPYSGGTLLGNRIRMQDSLNRTSIFMRSLASRGFKGGLSSATLSTIKILDAAGYDTAIIETVGAGQTDIDIMKIADTTIVMHAPGLGDIVQSIKAGIMEIGDVFVVNKIDRDGSYLAIKDIEDSLAMTPSGGYPKKVIGVNSLSGENIPALVDELMSHRSHISKERKGGNGRFMMEVQIYIEDELRRIIDERSEKKGDLYREMTAMAKRGVDPYNGAEIILSKILR